jgi:phospho-N-acetylmuramoyl-pentapeptide-transferase
MGRVLIAGTASLLICIFLSPQFIEFVRRREFGQHIREEGPEGHHEKAGTPTMGGIIIFAAITVPFLILSDYDWRSIGVMIAALLCALLGFTDDYMKIVRRRSLGLRGRTKIGFQVVIALILWWVATERAHLGSDLKLWIVDGHIDLGPFYPLLILLVVAGTTNAVNLTDGLDGLAGHTAAVAFVAYGTIAFLQGQVYLVTFCFTVAGALLAFLWFNAHPAQVIMGDTGALALGATLAVVALMLGQVLLLPIIGAVYVAVAFSVIAQVGYFRLSSGKRLLLRAPLHRHFEVMGWSQMQVAQRFWLVSMVTGLLGVALALR